MFNIGDTLEQERTCINGHTFDVKQRLCIDGKWRPKRFVCPDCRVVVRDTF